MAEKSWSWRTTDGAAGRLLYEPGNWGDLLKAAWAVQLAGWLRRVSGGEELRLADLFAGAPLYPIGARSRKRALAAADALPYRLLQPFLAQGAWPSAGRLLLESCRQPEHCRLEVFDRDPQWRAAWNGASAVTILDGDCGWSLASERPWRHTHLLLLDPYDIVKEWPERLPAALAAATETSVLLYVYNRSGRGREALRHYRDFRNALEQERGEAGYLLGRVPADSFLPSAHHEMVFLPRAGLARHASFEELRRELEATSLRLAAVVQKLGVFEAT